VQAAVDRLAEADCKHHLAYVLDTVAEHELRNGRPEAARARAEHARALAEAVDRPAEVILARTLIARAELAAGERAAAERSIVALRDRLAPDAVSARSSSLLRQLVDTLGVHLALPPEKE
jgi:hypothetical protein